MTTRFEFETAQVKEDRVILTAKKEAVTGKEVIPSGRMLVDSDSLSFIYVLDSKEGFIYVSLPESVWPALKTALHRNWDVEAVLDGRHMKLDQLTEELNYLIDNIEGNANYGNDMVETVERYFLQTQD